MTLRRSDEEELTRGISLFLSYLAASRDTQSSSHFAATKRIGE
jgi:hypothetical protein